MNGFLEMYIRTVLPQAKAKNRQGPGFPTRGTTISLRACHNRIPSRDLNDDMTQCHRHTDVLGLVSPLCRKSCLLVFLCDFRFTTGLLRPGSPPGVQGSSFVCVLVCQCAHVG